MKLLELTLKSLLGIVSEFQDLPLKIQQTSLSQEQNPETFLE